MNSVSPIQEGIASALSSISIQLGGILGIALQGAVFSSQLTKNLEQSLTQLQLSETTKDSILADALHSLSTVPQNLPISELVLKNSIRTAFVVGLQSVLWVAAIAIIIGIVLMIVIPQKQPTQTASTLTTHTP